MKATLTVERPEPSDNELDEISGFAGGAARIARGSSMTSGHTTSELDLQSGTLARVIRESDAPDFHPSWKAESTRGTTFVALHSWEGVVESVSSDVVFVRLFDAFHAENPEVITSIAVDEIDSEDRMLMVEGAVFYWSVGFAQSSSGRRRSSVVRFRRLPAWTPAELSRAQDEAVRLKELFGAEDA